MSKNVSQKGKRALSGIESDLLKAEAAFADADVRYKEAERDRRLALETINKHQMEMDSAIDELRQLSMPGTKWRLEMGEDGEALELNRDDIVSESQENVPSDDVELALEQTKKAFTKDFELLKASAQPRGEDPVLKVVASPKG